MRTSLISIESKILNSNLEKYNIMESIPLILSREELISFCKKKNRVKYVFFWGHTPPHDRSTNKSCFSQWFEASFEVDGIFYRTAEHFMMAKKAELFNDQENLQKILNAKHPKAAKRLGRKVKDFSAEIWDQNCFDFVVQGNLAKFSQNKQLKDFLLSTKNRVLVEASSYDKIWGIGLQEDHPHAESPEKWQGLNLLGFALMKVRRLLQTSI
ncbi:MAG: ribA/ribD-fused uncharacterized protein [bacterium]|jgi:ribA/ribD-fused uncharacterized protein